MNYQYKVILQNGVTFYATSKDELFKIRRQMSNGYTILFDNAVVNPGSAAAVLVYETADIEWPTT